jgi:peptidoglycan hydrolase-like protein with peptidoglycan-binding domain
VSSILRVRTHARHAKPSKAAPVLAAAGLSASFVAADAVMLASSASAATADDFARLRQCESGGNYAINTGNGFYGAYQFDRGTWNGLGYPGRADQAAPATQDAAAATLQSQRGWSPWPACSRKLGLGSSSSSAAPVVVSQSVAAPKPIAAPPVRASRSRFPGTVTHHVRVAVAPTTPPAFVGRALTVADAGTYRADVATWQHRMAARGWHLRVDGYFGPQTSAIAKTFAAQKRLHLTVLPGEVDKGVWDAAWRLPVS